MELVSYPGRRLSLVKNCGHLLCKSDLDLEVAYTLPVLASFQIDCHASNQTSAWGRSQEERQPELEPGQSVSFSFFANAHVYLVRRHKGSVAYHLP
jgi:hypothetical protein